MTDPADVARWVVHPTPPGEARDEHERRDAARILDLVRRLAARQAPKSPTVDQDESASLAALRIGTSVGQQLPPRPEALVCTEIGAAVLAAPWLADERARESALVYGLRVAIRLLPPAKLDLGRDTGTWGAIAGAVAIAADKAPEEIAMIACSAASLALAPVTVTRADIGYCALRAGHAAASAHTAVSLFESGFVGDPEAIDELRHRLGVGQESTRHREEAVASAGIGALEEAIR